MTTTPASCSRKRRTSSEGRPSRRTSTITNSPPSGTSGSTPGCRAAGPRPGRAGPDTPRPSARTHAWSDREGAGGGVLHERGRPAAGLLQHQQHRPDDLGRPGAVADAPAGHGIGLRQAVDEHRPAPGLRRQRGRRDVAPAVVDERLVDLVADDEQVVLLGEVHQRPGAPARVRTVPTGFQGVLSSTTRVARPAARLQAGAVEARTGRRGSSDGTATGRPPQRAIGEA